MNRRTPFPQQRACTATPQRRRVRALAMLLGFGACLVGAASAQAQDSAVGAVPRIVTIQPAAPLAPNQLPGVVIGPATPDLAPLPQRDLQSYRGSYEDRTRRRPIRPSDDPAVPAARGIAPLDQQKQNRHAGALGADIRRLEMDAARNRLGVVERRALDEARRDGDRLHGGAGRR